MDYISGDLQPRQIPKPTCYNQDLIQPCVPDISLFLASENSKHSSQNSKYKNEESFSSYNKWKQETNTRQIFHMHSENKEVEKNICGNINNIKTPVRMKENNSANFKKVRFEATNLKPQMCFEDLENISKTSRQISPERIMSKAFQERYITSERYLNTRNDTDVSKNVSSCNYPLKRKLYNEYPVFQHQLDLSIMEPRPPIAYEHYPIYNSESNIYSTSNFTEGYKHIGHREGHRELLSSSNRCTMQSQAMNKTNSLRTEDSLTHSNYQDWVSKNTHNLKNLAIITGDISNQGQSTEHSKDIDKSNISELYKIIQMQNEQLKSLQTKIEQFLDETSSKIVGLKERNVESEKSIAIQTNNVSDVLSENPMTVSVGLMTSLEFVLNKNTVSEMNPEYDSDSNSKRKLLNCNEKVLCIEKNCENSDVNTKEKINATSDKSTENTEILELQCLPQIRQTDLLKKNKVHCEDHYNSHKGCLQKKQSIHNDVSVIDNNNKVNDYSFTLNDITELSEMVNDTSISTSSLHLELQEFNNSKSEASDVPYSNIGWTIYNNVVDQVKNILEKAPNPNTVPVKNDMEQKSMHTYNGLLEQVKNATLQHLCNLGISLVNTNTTPLTSFSHPDVRTLNKSYFDVNDMSLEINQLIMKYFHNDQLSELIVKNKENQETNQQNEFYFLNGKNEISFSTMKYMQKYNLLEQKPKSKPVYQKANENIEKPPQKLKMRTGTLQNKILDITALKQQPKLL